jgi:DNA-binding helix-hairpin-helix protein with protein kinase domain
MNNSEKVKKHLIGKLEECQRKLEKLERKRKIIKKLYIATVVLSIITSGVVSVTSMIAVPILIIPILSSFGAILTGVSVRFNFHDKKTEIKRVIEKFNKIKTKLEFVIACNGDLTQSEYEEIMKNF